MDQNIDAIKFQQEVHGVREFKLKNGMALLLIPDTRQIAVTTHLIYRSGSSKEKYGQKGLAHLLEHLLLIESGANVKKNFQGHISDFRVKGITNFDFTDYQTWPGSDTKTLKFALQYSSSMMASFNATPEQLEQAKRQVINERENTGAGRFNFLLREATSNLFTWHAYGRDPVGIPSDLQNLTLSDMQEFWYQHYRPENATLIISGKYDEADVLNTVLQLFGPISEARYEEKPIVTVEPPQNGEREIVLLRKTTAPYAIISYRAVDINHPDAAAMDLLSRVLLSAERTKNDFSDLEKIKSTRASYMLLQQAGLLMFGIDFQYGISEGIFKTKFIDVLENLPKQPVTEQAFLKAKKAAARDHMHITENSDELAFKLLTFIAGGNWQRYFTLQQDIQNYDLTQLQKKGEEWITSSNRLAITLREPVRR
ncbi:M16 family metallopeptidase [Undibacterium pigrum]|uniref:M16 family metallopeptidase n=1 Tax=Undibacterium pigrum TaxID=401470 RepID=UPI001474867F|nr:insulinase family protein [Undibacterium pigrum]